MVTTSPRPPHPKGYTILESIIVLGILVILSWVAFALYKHEEKPAKSTDQNPPAISAAADDKPVDPPPAGSDAPKE